MSGYPHRFSNQMPPNYPKIEDDSEVYSEADDLYLAMDGVNEFHLPVENKGFSAQLGNMLNKSFESRNPPPSPNRRPNNNQWSKPAIPQRAPIESPPAVPKPRERRHSAAPPGFVDREKAHPPMGISPFANAHPINRMPPLSGPEIIDQDEYLTFDTTTALPYYKPSPAEPKKKKQVVSYDDHALPPRPPPQPPRPQERIPSSKSDGHSPVTSRNTSVKDTSPFNYFHGNTRNTDAHSSISSRPASVKDSSPLHPHSNIWNNQSTGHSPVSSRPASLKDSPLLHFHSYERSIQNAGTRYGQYNQILYDDCSSVTPQPRSVKGSSPLHHSLNRKHNRSTGSNNGHSPVTSRPPSVKDLPPFHSHIPDRKHNRSTDSASSTSSDDLTMVPRPMAATGQSMPFNKPTKMPTRFPPATRGAPNHTTAMMPPLEPVAASKPAGITDLSKPTEDQPWFMNTSRDGAQRAIEGKLQNGIFVVRPKHESNYQPYALTLWANGKFKNLVIRRKSDGEFALGSEKAGELSFKTVVAMIDYYQRHELNIADSSAITLISWP